MQTAEFDFELPTALIAQAPAPQRDLSRLLVLHRNTGRVEHRTFRNLTDYIAAGDTLVLNNTRVIPARLRGFNARSGGRFEILLLTENQTNDWWAMMRPAKRARTGTRILLKSRAEDRVFAEATVTDINEEGRRRLQFDGVPDIRVALEEFGEVPLPPYIRRAQGTAAFDHDRYQTVFAQTDGSVAAPTAGLHFTKDLLETLMNHGIRVCFVTLHVGVATFAPISTDQVESHTMHEEWYDVSEESARIINGAKQAGRRIIAVGTTSTRVMESVASANEGKMVAGHGSTKLFVHPPFRFRMVDRLLTNFHLPRSTLLVLASAFAAPGAMHGRELLLAAYAEAIREQYRFFSYGDAMLLL